jgi:hypothetical protein
MVGTLSYAGTFETWGYIKINSQKGAKSSFPFLPCPMNLLKEKSFKGSQKAGKGKILY